MQSNVIVYSSQRCASTFLTDRIARTFQLTNLGEIYAEWEDRIEQQNVFLRSENSICKIQGNQFSNNRLAIEKSGMIKNAKMVIVCHPRKDIIDHYLSWLIPMYINLYDSNDNKFLYWNVGTWSRDEVRRNTKNVIDVPIAFHESKPILDMCRNNLIKFNEGLEYINAKSNPFHVYYENIEYDEKYKLWTLEDKLEMIGNNDDILNYIRDIHHVKE